MDKVSILNIVNNIHHIDGNFKGCIYYISDNDEYNNPSNEFEVVTLSNIDEKAAFIAAIYDMIKHQHNFSLIINSSPLYKFTSKQLKTLYNLSAIYDLMFLNPSREDYCLMMNGKISEFVRENDIQFDESDWFQKFLNTLMRLFAVGKLKTELLYTPSKTSEESKEEPITTEESEKIKETKEMFTNEPSTLTWADIADSSPRQIQQTEKPTVWVYTLCYNEIRILPFVIDYWETYADRVIVYDNGSNDGSVEYLLTFDWIEVRKFKSNGLDDITNRNLKNDVWKESVGKADIVQVCDLDEVIWADDIIKELNDFKNSNNAIWNSKCYQLTTETFPIHQKGILINHLKECKLTYDKVMSKNILFKPNLIDNMNYDCGCHSSNPRGKNTSLYTNDNIKMFHLKWLGKDYVLSKYHEGAKRLSYRNKIHRYGWQYTKTDDEIIREYNSIRACGEYYSKMNKTAIVAIAKMENNYLREWVEYHKSIGITHIFLYDNNDLDGERFDSVINDYISDGYVEVFDVRGKKGTVVWRKGYTSLQIEVYDECYQKHKNEYEWFAFIDIDEFIITVDNNINTTLSSTRYGKYDAIKMCWKYYDDNNHVQVKDNNYNCMRRFTHHNPIHNLYNEMCKIFLRGGLDIHVNSCHGFQIENINFPKSVKVCNARGEKQNNKFIVLDGYKSCYDFLWLNHYRCKTIEEYVTKCYRGWPDDLDKELGQKPIDNVCKEFFKHNTRTIEKVNIANKLLKEINNNDAKR